MSSPRRFPKKPASIKPLEDEVPDSETSSLARAVADKQQTYFDRSERFKYFYYGTRIVAAFSTAIIPFTIGDSPTVATWLSVAVVLATATDLVFQPQSRWKQYSRASDLLFYLQAKKQPDFDEHRESIELIIDSEKKFLDGLVDLEALVMSLRGEKVQNQEPTVAPEKLDSPS